jgi:gliding-associated putative ABC transporter substrate-binding component GldG
MLTSTYHSRIDLTNEKRFTLSNSTKQLLTKIDQPLKIEVLLKGNLPSGFKNLASSAEDILREFKEVTGANLVFHFVSPDETFENTAVTYADTLSSMGFFPINLTSQLKDGQEQKMVYPIAILYYENKIVPIELYKGKTPLINFQELSSAEAMLEYNLSSGIAKLLRKQKAVVGYAIGNGEPL